ncbi:MAG: uroporphyrinogen decarboxylase family protein, partial [Candidatus Latescibacteria bacterium]|nr:uroporphyrinogen decarboxylase family protein [Candidatus Latescibacterota bacterium]
MESYERVTAALERLPLDRVPMRLNARTEVIAALKVHLGLDSDEALLQRLGIDFRYVGMRYVGPRPKPGFVPQNAPPRPQRQKAVSVDGYENNFRVWAPFGNMADVTELDPYEAHIAEDLSCQDPESIQAMVEKINAKERYFIGVKGAGRIFMAAQELRGAEQFMMDLMLYPEFAHRLLEIRTVHTIQFLEKVLSTVGDVIDVVQYNDDLGTQRGLLISPETFRTFLLPRYARIFETVHRYGKRLFMHCCGAIRMVIPDLIDAGVEILNPVQTGAVGMRAEGLKHDFGDRLTFCGGIDVQSTLPFGTPEDVRQEVIERIEVLGDGGGY